jgi:hypothetical protein
LNVLLDESVPRLMARHLTEHAVQTVRDLGWLGIKNGALLSLANGKFDLLLTADQSLPYQQRVGGRQIAIRILPTNHWPTLKNHIGEIRSEINMAEPGTCERIEF